MYNRVRMSRLALCLAVGFMYFAAATLDITTRTSHEINGDGFKEGFNEEDAPSGSHGYDHQGGGGQEMVPAILLALEKDAAGKNALLAWSRWAEGIASSHRTPPAIWVICTDSTTVAASVQAPHVDPFFVRDKLSWATVFRNFMARRPQVWVVGLLGEGALPHPASWDSILSMQLALFEALPPTAVLTRSRSIGGLPGEEERWLSDKFVSQLWCNRAALEASILAKAGLTTSRALELTLLQVLRRLTRDAVDNQLVLVDGTNVIGSVFDAPPASSPASGENACTYPGTSSDPLQCPPSLMETGGAEAYIGRLDFALVYDGAGFAPDTLQGGGKGQAVAPIETSRIVKAPWPPAYILETVAMNTTAAESKGLVLVSNVNCGYLGMATNFLLSVRNTSNAKVRHGCNQLLCSSRADFETLHYYLVRSEYGPANKKHLI